MSELYEWLYDHYALAQLKHAHFPACYQKQEAEWNETLSALDLSIQFQAADWINCVQLHWGTEAFRLGVEFGLALKNSAA